MGYLQHQLHVRFPVEMHYSHSLVVEEGEEIYYKGCAFLGEQMSLHRRRNTCFIFAVPRAARTASLLVSKLELFRAFSCAYSLLTTHPDKSRATAV